MTGNSKPLKNPVQIVIKNGDAILCDRLFENFPIILGRSQKCHIALPQFDFISRQHLALTQDEHGLALVDLNSSNGFTLNGTRVTRAAISDESEIRVGILHISVIEVRTQSTQPTVIVDSNQTIKVKMPHSAPATFNAPAATQAKPTPIPPVEAAPNVPFNDSADVRSINTSGDSAAAIIRPAARPTTRATIKNPLTSRSGQPHLLAYPNIEKLPASEQVLEGFVTWHDEIYDTQQFYPGQRVSVGTGFNVGLNLPTIRHAIDFAVYDGKDSRCFIPQSATAEVRAHGAIVSMSDLMSSQALVKKGGGYILKMGQQDLVSVHLDDSISLHFRYAPAGKRLQKKNVLEPDQQLRRSTLISGFVHLFCAFLAVINAPRKGMEEPLQQPRIARLLTEAPKPKPPEPPKPKEERRERVVKIKKERLKQEVAKKAQPKPQKVVIRQKLPPMKTVGDSQVKGPPVKMKEPEVNVQSLGALAALSAMPSSKPSDVPASLNINKNAGGKPGPTASGLITSMSTVGGKLPPGGGMGSVKTKGLGYGTGTGYGTQGVGGRAGQRGVAGAVVGTPQLVKIKSDEGLTHAQVMAVVKKYLGEIQNCYERALVGKAGQPLSGRIEYEWDISPKGSVGSVRVKKSEMAGGDALNSCVFGVFKSMKFPVAKNGQSTYPNIGFPFGQL